MCGRVACSLGIDAIRRQCKRRQANGKWSQPQWRPAPDGGQYNPTYNGAPSNYLPVMVSKKHFDDKDTPAQPAEPSVAEPDTVLADDEVGSEFVIQPMRWGLIPPWHNGDTKSAGYNTINARSDGMCSKNTYKRPLEKGRRCVVLVDGYFEWNSQKQPYFIYSPQGVSTSADDLAAEPTEAASGERKLLTIAGIFDIYRPKNGGAPLYSYSIITVDAHKNLSWLHQRMPAVLTTQEEVEQWLDFGNIPLDKAVKLIRPTDQVSNHPVSKTVNSVKNKSADCVKAIKKDASSSFMAAWLSQGQKRKSSEGQGEPGSKKLKP